MINYYGQWTYEPDTPKEKKCDCDRIADWIKEKDYKPKTTIENFVSITTTPIFARIIISLPLKEKLLLNMLIM